MNSLARALAIFVLVVFVDGFAKFGAFKRVVRGAATAYCAVANKSPLEREDCERRVFYSKGVWLAISLLVGAAAGYVTAQLLSTRRW